MQNIPKYILWFLAVTVGIFLIWYFSDIVTYILISAVLAIIGKPLVELLLQIRLKGRHLPAWCAASVTLLTIWTVMLMFFSIFIPLIFSKVSEFSSLDLHHLVDAFRQPITVFQNFLEHNFSIHRSDFSLADSLTRHMNSFFNIEKLNIMVTSTVSTIGHVVVALFAISFITFFFLKDEQLFVNMVIAVMPSKYESNIKHAFASITNLLIRYFTGLLIESTIILTVVAVILILCGMSPSDAFFIGLLMGVLNVIPYIGPLIGVADSIFIGILNPIEGFTAAKMAITIGVTILAVKCADDFILQPVLYSNSVKAHPLEIFLVILTAGSIAGVLGMLLAIPSYNVIRVFAKEFFNKFRLVQKLTEKI